MNHVNHYSIVILPPDKIIEKVDELKMKLHLESNEKYSSYQSMAHITIQEFWSTENRLNKIILKCIRIAREQKIFAAEFDKVICSGQNSFFLPDDKSKVDLERLIKKIRLEVEGHVKSNAHISIGRRLSAQQFEISRKIFSDETLKFDCNRIALRKLNDKIKQFEIVEIFPFFGQDFPEIQLTLW